MTTAIAPTPIWTPFPARMADWTPEHRTYAAGMAAWQRQWRRSPEGIARTHLDALMKTTDPRILRLAACDQAGEVVPLYQAKYPEDPRVAALLYVSRRYAEGMATEKERLAASRLAVAVCVAIEARDGLQCPSTCAAEAAGFTLWKNAADALRFAASWAHNARCGYWAHDPDEATRLSSAIEARLDAF